MENLKLAEALAKAQAEFKAPAKNKIVTYSGRQFGYADLLAVIESIKPLSKYGIAFTQTIKHEGQTILVTTLHMGLEKIESFYPLPDPSTSKPQEFGAALTYARRYSLSTMLGIAADEDDDAQCVTTPPKAPQPQAKPQPAKPNPPALTQPQVQRLFAVANSHKWTTDQVKLYMQACWQIESTTQLTRETYDLLIKVIESSNYVNAIKELGME